MSYDHERSSRDEVPDMVQRFVKGLHRSITQRNVAEVQHIYDNEFGSINKTYYKSSTWPKGEVIAPYVDRADNTVILYKEIYYRQAFSRAQVSLEDRIDAFNNYIALFNILLGLKEDEPELDLPASWLWDMVDAFVEQFQSFHVLRSDSKKHTPQEQALLKKNEHVWSAQTVIVFLEAIMNKAQVKPVAAATSEDDIDGGSDKKDNIPVGLLATLGQFAAIGLSRVHSVVCDYYGAIQVLASVHVDLQSGRALYRSCPGAASSLYTSLVFSYFMLRRYVDCIETGANYLNHITRAHRSSSPNATKEKMIAVLSMAFSICPKYADENLSRNIMDQPQSKLAGLMTRMQHDDATAYEEVFTMCCPRFINPATPNYDAGEDPCADTLKLQLKIFQTEIKQRANLKDIYSHLKLCSTISTSKLASFLGVDEDTLGTYLFNVKHKTQSLRWCGGAPLDGKWKSSADVDFYVTKDMIQVADTSNAPQYGHHFIRQIQRLEDIIKDLRKDWQQGSQE